MKTLSKSNVTRNAIRKAIIRIQNGRPRIISANRRLSISAVAEEAGMTNANLHNNYPDLVDKIRAITDKSMRSQRNEKQIKLKKARAHIRELLEENAILRSDLTKIASENLRLTLEIKTLKAKKYSGNVLTLRPKPR